jgi:IS30 family transposase
MKNKGNQKHLTFEQRVDIEKGLTENKSFTEIGRIIGKNPSTISKEVRLHAHIRTSGFRLHSPAMYSSQEL